MEARAILSLKVQALESEHSEFESKLGQLLTKVTASSLLPLTDSFFFLENRGDNVIYLIKWTLLCKALGGVSAHSKLVKNI